MLKSIESGLEIGFLFQFEKEYFKIMLRIPDKVIGYNALSSKQHQSKQLFYMLFIILFEFNYKGITFQTISRQL